MNICPNCKVHKRGVRRELKNALCDTCEKRAERAVGISWASPQVRETRKQQGRCPDCGQPKRGKARRDREALCSVCARYVARFAGAPVVEPTEAASTEAASTEAASTEAASTEAAPTEAAPTEPTEGVYCCSCSILDWPPQLDGEPIDWIEGPEAELLADLMEVCTIDDLTRARAVLQSRFETAACHGDVRRWERTDRALDQIDRVIQGATP